MKATILYAALLVGMTMSLEGQGRVVFEEPVYSKALATNRLVRIYLPPSYERAPDRRFPVLYVHDGQNAFTTVGTNVAFGWGNWEIDRTVTQLCAEGKMEEILVVAVDCSRERYLDYRGPACRYSEAELKSMDRPPPAPGDDSHYENYKRFLVEELKPRIDGQYRTLTNAAHTGVLGSSMGGICSLSLAWDRPDVFGKAASLSGAFWVERTNFLVNIVGRYTGRPKPVRVYLDSGVCDFSGGDDDRRNTEAMADALRRLGWREGTDLQHHVDARPMSEAELERTGLRRDKLKEAQTSQHNEFYWRQRVWRPLVFLFPPSNPGTANR